MILEDEIKKLLTYDPITGEMKWLKWKSGRKASLKISSSNKKGYLRVFINGKSYGVHVIAWIYMTGKQPSGVIDHKDQNIYNNKFSNLRDVSKHQNLKNASKSKRNKTGVTGVHINKNGTYYAQIRVNGKSIHLGCFEELSDASDAREEAKKTYGFDKNHGKNK